MLLLLPSLLLLLLASPPTTGKCWTSLLAIQAINIIDSIKALLAKNTGNKLDKGLAC